MTIDSIETISLDFVYDILATSTASSDFCDGECQAGKVQSAVCETRSLQAVELTVDFGRQVHRYDMSQRGD